MNPLVSLPIAEDLLPLPHGTGPSGTGLVLRIPADADPARVEVTRTRSPFWGDQLWVRWAEGRENAVWCHPAEYAGWERG